MWKELKIIIFCLLESVFGQCQDGWQYYITSCYRVFEEREPYNTALRRCGAYQGHLVTLKSSQENGFVNDLTSGFIDDQFWIGLDVNRVPMAWLDDRSQVTWSLWRGHGRDLPPLCALMVRGQSWTSNTCSYLYRFVCEIPMQQYESTSKMSTETVEIKSQMYFKPTPTSTSLPKVSTIDSNASHARSEHISTTKMSALTTTTAKETTELDTFPSIIPSFPSTTRTLIDINITTSTLKFEVLEIVIKRNKNPGKTYTDNRPSAVGLGSLGFFVLLFTILGIVLLDASKLFKDCKMLVRNLSHAWKRFQTFSKRVFRVNPEDSVVCTGLQEVKLQ